MKVVINTCYGGFGLSPEATRALIGCPHIQLMDPKEYYGGRDGWEKDFAKAQNREEGLFGVTLHDGKVVIDNHSHGDEARNCPALVRVVESMGKKANGFCADLKVVNIPDGMAFEISEYDGREHVAESHQTWS